PGLSPDQVSQYFSELPPALVPRIQSPGERHRLRELLRQLPPHDLEPQFCHDLSESERRELKLFAQRRKRENLGQGSVRPLPLTSPGTVCQQCCHCHQPLVDLVYFCPGGRGGRLLCGRHHGETLRDRCPGCDELIFGVPVPRPRVAAGTGATCAAWSARDPGPQSLQEGAALCPLPCPGAHLCDTCGDPNR
ncbi:prickle-like protein 2, partial [Myiozetetes cayanensis]|uniref:prickle-like protein 2 n=1 Tax=Myiozetetes cayanensis TaxID=478635 RepID=UPI0021602216